MEKLAFFCLFFQKKSFICAFYSHRRPVCDSAPHGVFRGASRAAVASQKRSESDKIFRLWASDPQTRPNIIILSSGAIRKVLRSSFDVRDWTTFINSVINTLHPFCVQWLSNESTDTSPKGAYELHRLTKGEFWREWMTSPILTEKSHPWMKFYQDEKANTSKFVT